MSREGFKPFDPTTWTDEERLLYAIGFGHGDNGWPCLIDPNEHERLIDGVEDESNAERPARR